MTDYFKHGCFPSLGEFTKRAFMAGKLDATEVEGLADLLRAETELQRRQALRQANGELAKLYNKWRSSIITFMAHLEAYVDFGDDQDIGEDVLNEAEQSVNTMLEEIKIHLNDNRRGERLRSGVRVAIVGEPNVGKSSLLNFLSNSCLALLRMSSHFEKYTTCNKIIIPKVKGRCPSCLPTQARHATS